LEFFVMTTRTSTLLAATAALGAAALFTAPAMAGTGAGPNYDPYPQTYSYGPSYGCSQWNRGGQIPGSYCGPSYGSSYYYDEPMYYGEPGVGVSFDFGRYGYGRDHWNRWNR
jgi:hypothetical protein